VTKFEFSFQLLPLIRPFSARLKKVQHPVFSSPEVFLFHSKVIPLSFSLNEADEYP